nr:alpha/beta fold hydrolase [Microbacterium bovistercoris]
MRQELVRVEHDAEIRGARLAWSVEGEGPTVVWGHGVTHDRWTMVDAGVYDFAPIVAAGFRLVRLDWRGHGVSGGGADPDEYTWPSLGADLLALLELIDPDEPVAAIGCSMGTGAILHAAVRAPERFRRLVLTAPPTAWDTRAAQAELYRRLVPMVASGGRTALDRAMAMAPPTGIFAELDSPLPVAVGDRVLPAVLEGAARSDLPDPDALRGLATPTLVLSWADDPGHPVSTGRGLHDLIPGSRFGVSAPLAEVRGWGARAASFLREDA